MKKQTIFSRIIEAITYPFISLSVLIDEDRRSNLDGRWDKYWERKNRKESRNNEKV